MNQLFNLIGVSVTRPAEAAAELLSLRITREAAMMILALSVIITVIVSFVMNGSTTVELVPGVAFTPLTTVGFLGLSAIVMGYGIYFTGNAMSGQGDLAGAFLVVAWLQVLQLAGVILQSAVFLVSPTLGGFLGLGIGIGLIWVLLVFIDVLQGFGSIGRSALLLLFVVVGIGLGLTLILGLLGFGQ
ncbi:MAG: hypothetical protein AAF092_04385 [Pseudomonadota bacterium]